jgi:hypothetical protein
MTDTMGQWPSQVVNTDSGYPNEAREPSPTGWPVEGGQNMDSSYPEGKVNTDSGYPDATHQENIAYPDHTNYR